MKSPSSHEVARRANLETADRGTGAASLDDNVDRSIPPAWFDHAPAFAYARTVEETHAPGASSIVGGGSQLEQALGLAPGELVEDPDLWASCIHPDDLGRVLATWRRPAEEGETYHLSYRMIARDGRVLDMLDEAALGVDPAAGTRSWYGVLVDVTANRTTLAELRDSEEKYQRLVEQIPTVTYIDEVDEDDPTDPHSRLHQSADPAPARVWTRGMDRGSGPVGPLYAP